MKKIRKFDSKNKLKILFVALLSLIIFSLFIFIIITVYKKVNEEFIVSKNSVLFDINNNIIKTDFESSIKNKWNNNWFLEYKEKKYNLGSSVVVYNENNGMINLYGTFYEVKNKGEIVKTKNNTLIESSAISKFYKISDRKYLLIDPIITSKGLTTSQYLIVDIEKSGYAFYTNNVVNVKTIEPTKIKTSTYEFDVNNETLTFYGDSEIINLKKILGSTNEYKEIQKSTTENSDTNSDSNSTSNSNVSNQQNITNNIISNSTNEIINNINTNSNIEIEKRTSIIGVSTTINSLNINYVVYDPRNEYENVFVLIGKEKYNLNKNLNSIIVESLFPNTTYNLEFKYSYYLDGVLKEDTFEKISVTTKSLDLEIKVNKITSNKIYYEVNDLQNVKYEVALYYNGEELLDENISKESGYIYLKNNIQKGYYMLKLKNITFNELPVSSDVYYKFNY